MSGELHLEYHFTPDGHTTIVQFKVGGEFAVPTLTAATDGRRVLSEIMSRLTGKPVEEVQREWAASEEAELWLGGSWRRPIEPDVPGSST